MDTGRPDPAVLSEVPKAKEWVRDEMKTDVWTPITTRQVDIFKWLMVEWYGWPVFSLNFNKAMNCVMKIKI